MKTIIYPLAVLASTQSLSAETLILETWGGAYSTAQQSAYVTPYLEETGNTLKLVDSDDPAGPLKLQTEADNITSDIFDVDASTATRMCEEGALEKITVDEPEDFLPGLMNDCGIPTYVWSTTIAYQRGAFATEPTTAADFFDLEKFPGKRALPRDVKRTLYLALYADGVPPSDVFAELATEAGVNRAFAKLESIRDQTIWWESGAQPMQLLADGEVVMATAYNGRIFDAVIGEGKDFGTIWDGQHMDTQMLVVPIGAPHTEEAIEFVRWATSAPVMGDLTRYISYSPARSSALPLVTTYKDGTTEMTPHMPTAEDRVAHAVIDEPTFWVDHGAELTERFEAWMAQN